MRHFVLPLFTGLLVLVAACADNDADPAGDAGSTTDVADNDTGGGASDTGDTAQDTGGGEQQDADAEGDTDDPGFDDTLALHFSWEGTEPEPSMVVNGEALSVVFSRGDRTLFTLDQASIQLGLIARLDPQKSYDPTGFFFTDRTTLRPPLLRWLHLTGIRVDDQGDTPALRLYFEEGRRAWMRMRQGSSGWSFEIDPDEHDELIAWVRLRPLVDADDHFYGMGEVFDQVEQRGTIRPMHLLINEMENGANEAHVPIPFLIGTRGWAWFVESFRPIVFDIAATDPDRVDMVVAVAEEWAEPLNFWFFSAENPRSTITHYYDVTGYPAIPAPWGLGPLMWRNDNEDEAQFRNDVRLIRELDLATTGLWIDRPYATQVGTWDWDPNQWDDVPAMIANANANGLRVGLWSVPYLDERTDHAAAWVQEAEERGFYPPLQGVGLNNWGRMIDLTNPEARAWWQDLVRIYTNDGIEGFKLDYGEDVTLGIFGNRMPWLFHDGSTDLTMHARLQLLYHSLYAELLPEEGGFLLCRGGTWGDQVNVSIIWPGDLAADFSLHGERITKPDGSTIVTVGGLLPAMIAGLSLGPSGYPLYGSDTGGYRRSPPNKETFSRWFQVTALSPMMQVGVGSSDLPWEFTERNGFDQEMLDAYRIYARIHLRLWPYIWSHLQAIANGGMAPIQIPVGLAYPDDGYHPSDAFLLGEDLYVAPVVEDGAREREVTFPRGRWVDWWSGERIDGSQTLLVDAPLFHLPIYLREGGIVPLLRDTIDTISAVEDTEAIDSLATTPGILTVLAEAGDQAGSFTLYDATIAGRTPDDQGYTLNYQGGEVFNLGVHFEVIGQTEPPSSVQVDGVALSRLTDGAEWSSDSLAWDWVEERGGTLLVQVPESSAIIRVNP